MWFTVSVSLYQGLVQLMQKDDIAAPRYTLKFISKIGFYSKTWLICIFSSSRLIKWQKETKNTCVQAQI